MSVSFTLPRWYDLHVHFRQGPAMAAYVQAHLAMGCAGVLAMPNTRPPVAKLRDTDSPDCWSIEAYQAQIAAAGGTAFDTVIVPLYLTQHTTPAMIEDGARSGLLRAAKYYPPHGTTNADQGRPLQNFIDNGVLKAMEQCGVTLCVHGEEHALSGPDYFDKNKNAETVFYRERLPRALDAAPGLRIACEHITTRTAVDFVLKNGDGIAASITPQHLLYTVGHLVRGLRYHLYCLPLVKFDDDRQALRDAVTDRANTQFYAGTDSAPHTEKATPCGCAAGCFTGGIAPQLYAQALEEAGVDLSKKEGQLVFEKFLCRNGPAFYGFAVPEKTFTLTRTAGTATALETPDGPVIPLPLGMEQPALEWSIA